MTDTEVLRVAKADVRWARIAVLVTIVALGTTTVISLIQRQDALNAFAETRSQANQALDRADEALELARQQSFSQARAEISSYVVEMARLDREGAERNRNEIVTLAKQVDTLSRSYRREDLRLPVSRYRLTAQYLTLATTELELAADLARTAEKLAIRPDQGGRADTLEAIQSLRVLADLAAQNLDLAASEKYVDQALALAEKNGGSNRYVRVESPRYTRAYRALNALMVAQVKGAESCPAVRRQYRAGADDLADLEGTYDVVRRAKRIYADPCRTGFDFEAADRRWDAFASAAVR